MANLDPPPNVPPRRKLDVEQPMAVGNFAKQGAVAIYALAAIILAGVAVYMAVVEQRPLMSGWVAAPAIGAVWFGLRLFMILGSRK
jgi:hypothetical protein